MVGLLVCQFDTFFYVFVVLCALVLGCVVFCWFQYFGELGGFAGREISEEEGNNRLAPSSTIVAGAFCGCGCRKSGFPGKVRPM